MTRPSTAKVSYERLAIDSGYLSDLEEAALKSNDDATALFASASANDGAYVILQAHSIAAILTISQRIHDEHVRGHRLGCSTTKESESGGP